MRKINYIVLHCTAGPQTQTVENILDYWKRKLGWSHVGYHHLIRPDGSVADLQPIELPTNGVAGYNYKSIHISYIGGVDKNNVPIDNRTEEQKQAQIVLLKKYHAMFPDAVIQGHRDFPNVKKACPSFDVKQWLNEIEFYK
jgi:N-acetylmuramoyl-L-alanine amidase